MILSRVWYVLLGLAVAVAMYVVYIAVGQYDRQATRALKEGLASDSQTVEWALKIDARRRLDALLAGSVDAVAAAGARRRRTAPRTARSPTRRKQSAKKALGDRQRRHPGRLARRRALRGRPRRPGRRGARLRPGRRQRRLRARRLSGRERRPPRLAARRRLAARQQDVRRRGAPRGVRRDPAPGGRHRGPQGGQPALRGRPRQAHAHRRRVLRGRRARGGRRRRRGLRRGEARRGRGRPREDRRQDVRRRRPVRGAHAHRRPRRDVRAPAGRRVDAGRRLRGGAQQDAARRARWASSATRTTRTRRTCPGRCSSASCCWRGAHRHRRDGASSTRCPCASS